MSFSNNQKTELNEKSTSKTLDLSNRKIVFIEKLSDNAFIEEINFEKNQIKEINKDTFKNNKEMHTYKWRKQ